MYNILRGIFKYPTLYCLTDPLHDALVNVQSIMYTIKCLHNYLSNYYDVIHLKVPASEKLYVLFVLLYILKRSKRDFLVLNMFKQLCK